MENKKDKNTDISIRDNLFYGNNLLHFAYKKTLKISKAIYLITEIIKDIEPIKWSLRTSALALIETKDFGDIRQTSRVIVSRIGAIKPLVLLAHFSKNVSDMNASVILKECDELIANLSDIENFNKDHLSLDRSFFDIQKEEFVSPFVATVEKEKSGTVTEQFFNKGHVKDSKIGVSFISSNRPQVLPKKDDGSFKVSAESVKDNNIKSDRREQIVSIIKDIGEVTIKDISNLIKDCSEKTIQRELISLLALGTIKKTGDRRWSKYSLIISG